MKMEMELSKGLGWFANYTYIFECGTWTDQKNFRSINFPGKTILMANKGQENRCEPLIIELDLNDPT